MDENKTTIPLSKTVRVQKMKNKSLAKQGKPQKTYNLLKEIDETERQYAEGEQFSSCQKCGETFEQDYRAEINVYTSFKTCHKCRSAVAKKKSGKEVQVTVSSLKYTPYPWQKKFHEDMRNKRFAVLACGSRSGKNRAVNMQFISDYSQLLNENRHLEKPDLVPAIHCWFVAPTEPMALQNWREMKAFFPKEWIVGISESTKTIETIGGGVIEVRSAYNPESLVGVALDFVSITEGARVKDLEEVTSNLEDRTNSPDRGIDGKGGRMIVDSSPLGKNFFYTMWTWGQESHPNYNSNWVSYQLPSTSNPMIAAKYKEMVGAKTGNFLKLKNGSFVKIGETYIEDGVEKVCEHGDHITYEESLRRRKGRKFLQDNLAQFISAGGSVFGKFKDNCVIDIYVEQCGKMTAREIKEYIIEWKSPKVAETYRVGYDPATGSGKDSPTIVVIEESTGHIVHIEDLYGKIGNHQINAVCNVAKRYNHAVVHVLVAGSPHAAAQIEEQGLSVVEVEEYGQKKKALVLSLQTAVDNGAIKVLDDGSTEVENLVFQMDDYTESETTGKFSNNVLDHDDFVSAMYAVMSGYIKKIENNTHYMTRIGGLSRKRR